MALTPLRGTSPPTVNSVAQVNPGDRVSADKSEIAPIVAVLSRQLPLPQAQQLAGQTALVKVVKSGPGGQTELEFAGQNIAVKLPQGKMLTAGEMVTVSFALGEKAEGTTTTSSGKKIQDNLSILSPLSLGTDEEGQEAQSSSFVSHLSTAGRLIGLLDQLGKGQPPQTLAQTPHNIKQLSTQAQQDVQNGLSNNLSGLLAHEVSSAVENSGLFYESHLQQWALGKRSTDQLAQEPQSHFGPEQRIAEQSLDPTAIAQSAKLVNAQLATLDHSKIALNLQGLFGQPIEVEIEPDPDSPEQNTPSEEASRPWSANLKLDMAHLGILQVRIRMVGSQCDVQISSSAESKKAIDPHWQEFEAAMSTHGLKLNHGQVSVSDQTREGGSVA